MYRIELTITAKGRSYVVTREVNSRELIALRNLHGSDNVCIIL